MRILKIPEESKIYNELKRWSILDARTNKVYDVTDKAFNDGLIANVIKLRGQYITIGNYKKYWIDGIVK